MAEALILAILGSSILLALASLAILASIGSTRIRRRRGE